MTKYIKKENLFEVLKQFESGQQSLALEKMSLYIKHNKDDFKNRYNFAYMLEKSGQREKAILNYKLVLDNDPNNWRALTNLYLIYFDQEKFEKSLSLVNKLLSSMPEHQPSLRDKAHLLFYLNRLTEAKKNVELSIKLNEKDYIAINILGMILDKMGLFNEAKAEYLKAIKIDKNYYPSYSNLGKTLLELQDIDNGIKVLQQGIKINPNFENAHNNLANAYNKIGRYNEAIEIYKKLLEQNPKHKDINSNIALSYFNNKNFKEAEKYFGITKNLNPDDKNFRKNFAHFLFYKQEYEQAWHYWEDRLNKDEYYINNEWKNKIREWVYTGPTINKGEKLLIIKEQGIGDEILFGTIYPNLLNEFPDCIIETDPRLISLFKRSYDADKNFVPFLSISNNENNFSKFDKIIFAGSLGKFYRKKKSDFLDKNKLNPDKQNLQFVNSLLKKIKGKKIGFSWKSKREFYGEGKSINLIDCKELFDFQNTTFINLQYGNIESDLIDAKNNFNQKIITLKEIDLMNDFEKISALLCNLDLFITVSNSTAHLAGALNVPTILIKPKTFAIFHYWNQPDHLTPWYPSIKLLEQPENIVDLINELKNLITKL